MGKKAEGTQSVVEAYDDDSKSSEDGPERCLLASTGLVSPAVKPDDDGERRTLRQSRRPDIKVQAVFTPRQVWKPALPQLWAGRTEGCCFARTHPRSHGLWRFPP